MGFCWFCVFEMPDHYSNAEYADILFVYGFCDGNGRAAEREYRRRFPERRVPHHGTFSTVFQFLREHGKLPSSAIRERPLGENVNQVRFLVVSRCLGFIINAPVILRQKTSYRWFMKIPKQVRGK